MAKLNDFEEIAKKHGTDKVGKHNYGKVYHDLFSAIRPSIKKVLEIGVAEGAGLRTFREYFPNAMIYGIDNQNDRIVEEERIKVYFGNQGFDEDLRKVIREIGRDIDIVIDDGSHWPSHQVFTCLTLMPLLKHDVTYIIEDVSDPKILKDFTQYDAELIECGERYDDKVIVVKYKS